MPAYTTNTTEDHAYLLGHSEARPSICSGQGWPSGCCRRSAQRPACASILFMERAERGGQRPCRLMGWAEALAEGATAPAVDHAEPARTADDLACFIYTSGTGGRPKGGDADPWQHHRQPARRLACCSRRIGLGDEVFLSFLPLSHAYEHTAGQFLPIALGAQIYYAEGVETPDRPT